MERYWIAVALMAMIYIPVVVYYQVKISRMKRIHEVMHAFLLELHSLRSASELTDERIQSFANRAAAIGIEPEEFYQYFRGKEKSELTNKDLLETVARVVLFLARHR